MHLHTLTLSPRGAAGGRPEGGLAAGGAAAGEEGGLPEGRDQPAAAGKRDAFFKWAVSRHDVTMKPYAVLI